MRGELSFGPAFPLICPASFLLSFFAKLTAQVIPHSHYDAMSVHLIGGVWLNRKPITVIKLKDIVKI